MQSTTTASAGIRIMASLVCQPIRLADMRDAEQSADDQAARPPGVQRVELGGLLVRIEGGDQRVDDGFHQPPADACDHRADPEHVCRSPRPRRDVRQTE